MGRLDEDDALRRNGIHHGLGDDELKKYDGSLNGNEVAVVTDESENETKNKGKQTIKKVPLLKLVS